MLKIHKTVSDTKISIEVSEQVAGFNVQLDARQASFETSLFDCTGTDSTRNQLDMNLNLNRRFGGLAQW